MHSFNSFWQELLIFVLPVLIAITFHEVAHGYTAYILGDPTAKNAGRLSLNPFKHLDPIGAIALLLIKLGWAKPVPINPIFFKHPKRDLFLVSFAGPFINFFLAFLFSLIIKGILYLGNNIESRSILFIISIIIDMCAAGILVNIGLGVFNLLPIPPLDGSNMIMVLMPKEIAIKFSEFGKYGIFLLMLLFFTGMVQKIMLPVVYFIVSKLLPT